MPAEKEDAGTQLLERFEMPEDESSNPPEKKVSQIEKAVAPAAKPQWLINSAKSVGISKEEYDSMSVAELKEAVQTVASTRKAETVDRDVQRVRDPNTGQFVRQDQADQTQPQTQPLPASKEITLEQFGIDSKKWGPDATAEEIGLDIVKGLYNHFAPYLEKIGGIENEIRTRTMNENYDKLDQLFVKQPKIFGDGSRFDMQEGTPELLRRKTVINAMAEMRKANPNMPLGKCFDKVTSALFGGLDPRPEQKADPKVEEFANATTTTPTVRATKPQPKGQKAAEDAVKQHFERQATDGDTSEHDELPD